jgi:hypothetical protein
MRVTNIWHVLNLRATPFFQDPLEPDGTERYPMSLFVGRTAEVDLILKEIGSSEHSRIALQGAPGVGKTTLVNYIKQQVAEDGYIADATPIRVTSVSTAAELIHEILTSVHDALIARDSTLANLEPMQEVRQLLDVERSRSFNVSINIPLTGGGGIGGGPQRFTGPGALTVQPTRLLRKLSDIAIDRLHARGVLIHLNNLENISEADQQAAARIIRDIRDTGLMYPGLHYLLAGTDDAIRTIVASQEQIRSVFHNPGPLQPLSEAELDKLLALRYQHLRLYEDQEPLPPVTPEAVHALYRIFHGNLRGTLHALNEAAKHLVGHGDNPTDPMRLDPMRPILRGIYAHKLEADLRPEQIKQLALIAERGIDSAVSQAEMQRPFGLKRAASSLAFKDLQTSGYLLEVQPEPTGRPGRPRQRYVLTGAAKLAFGALDAS